MSLALQCGESTTNMVIIALFISSVVAAVERAVWAQECCID